MNALRGLLKNRWVRAFLIWTAFIAILVLPLWPAATRPFTACVSPGAIRPDPTLPPCPPDDANYEGIFIFLLLVLWAAGVAVLVAGSLVARARRRR